ncbi:MAG: hypothetical protein GXP13_09600 [Gammaproteobacteria bacterium]|nr:hypothetical protein [Gammaproteobacteria bacterium]
MSTLHFLIFDNIVRVRCDIAELRALLLSVYGSLYVDKQHVQQEPALDYQVYYLDGLEQVICLHRNGQKVEHTEDIGFFLFLFEKDMTIELEHIRSDLYFLHAAALEYKGKIHLLVAESGGGKSTTSWALLHHGFRYASDELAPVELDSMKVNVYPHALCLKTEPPSPYTLPKETIYTERTMHVPVDAMPADVVKSALPLSSILFVRYVPGQPPGLQPVSYAQAGARVYANGLNQLAHPTDGLDAAIEIARHCHCYQLESSDLNETCLLVKEVLDRDMAN